MQCAQLLLGPRTCLDGFEPPQRSIRGSDHRAYAIVRSLHPRLTHMVSPDCQAMTKLGTGSAVLPKNLPSRFPWLVLRKQFIRLSPMARVASQMHSLSSQVPLPMLRAARLSTTPVLTAFVARIAPSRSHCIVAAAGTGRMVKATWSRLPLLFWDSCMF